MTLVMFDVDGTLTESSTLDSAAYLDALADVFGFRDVSGDWAGYKQVTDAGILDEVFRVRSGRAPTAEEIARMHGRFVELVSARLAEAGGLRPVAGAAEMLAQLSASPEHAVTYASGGWGASARLKLRAAGLPVDGVPGAFSDDALSREDICRISRRRAEAQSACAFGRVVYVGDGVWDVRTSRNLGYGFVGIGRDEGAAKLRAAGAAGVEPDFRDPDAFLVRLATAEPPRLPG